MGIPSYFSHIIRNYSKIIRSLSCFKNGLFLNNLFLDCNSLIYDSVYSLQKCEENNNMSDFEFESIIIDNVVDKLQKLIQLITPNNVIYVAFESPGPRGTWS